MTDKIFDTQTEKKLRELNLSNLVDELEAVHHPFCDEEELTFSADEAEAELVPLKKKKEPAPVILKHRWYNTLSLFVVTAATIGAIAASLYNTASHEPQKIIATADAPQSVISPSYSGSHGRLISLLQEQRESLASMLDEMQNATSEEGLHILVEEWYQIQKYYEDELAEFLST